jgi:hypothetical protein
MGGFRSALIVDAASAINPNGATVQIGKHIIFHILNIVIS